MVPVRPKPAPITESGIFVPFVGRIRRAAPSGNRVLLGQLGTSVTVSKPFRERRATASKTSPRTTRLEHGEITHAPCCCRLRRSARRHAGVCVLQLHRPTKRRPARRPRRLRRGPTQPDPP